MGITEDDREVKLTFENGKIVIEKKNNECDKNKYKELSQNDFKIILRQLLFIKFYF